MPSKLGFGNSRKRSATKATYGSALHFKKPLKHKVEHAGTVSGHSHKGGVGNRPVIKEKYPKTLN